MGTRSSQVTSQAINDEYAGRVLNYVWNTTTLQYEVQNQAGAGGGGGGGPATIADGADVAEGATTDAEAAAGNGSVIALLKRIRTLLGGPIAVTGTFFQATQPVSLAAAVDVSDRAGRLLGVIASVTAAIDVGDRAARVLGRAQILDSASAIIDPATKGQLPAALVGGRLDVNVGASAAIDVSDRVGRALGVVASITAAVDVSDRAARLLGKTNSQERETGYANVALYAEAVAGIIAETAISINKSVAYAAAAAATSNGASAAKELVIMGMIISWVSTSTTANTARVRIRVNPGGAAIITSPIALTFRISWESATFIANEGEFQPIMFEKAIIIPNPGQFMATIACVAANGTLDIQLIAYERTP